MTKTKSIHSLKLKAENDQKEKLGAQADKKTLSCRAVVCKTASGDIKTHRIPNGAIGSILIDEMIKSMVSNDTYRPKGLQVSDEGQISADTVIEPPFSPASLASLLTLNATHSRCCQIKATDITAQGYKIKPSDEFEVGSEAYTDEDKKYINTQKLVIKNFMKRVGNKLGYVSLSKKVCLDYESIGYCTAEVIRNPKGEILDCIHLPSKSIRFAQNVDGEYYYIQTVGNEKRRFIPFGTKFIFDVDQREEEPLNIDTYNYLAEIKAHAERKVKQIKIVASDFSSASGDTSILEVRNPDNLSAADMQTFSDSANELLFIKQDHPASDLYGIPDIIPANTSINTNISVDSYVKQFFDNNAVPQYMIIIKGADEIDEETIDTITKYFKEEVKGNNHSTLLFPLPEGMDITVEKLSVETKEASFQDLRKNNRDDILVAHGMTPAQVGIIDVASLGSGTGFSQAENYKDRILSPRQSLFESQMWNRLFGKEGMGLLAVEVEFNTLDIKDIENYKDKHEKYVKNGIMSINEARAELGLEEILGGDRNFIHLGTAVAFVDAFVNRGLTVVSSRFEDLKTDSSDNTKEEDPVDKQMEEEQKSLKSRILETLEKSYQIKVLNKEYSDAKKN